MILYLIRHAKAENTNPDEARKLSPEGREKILRASQIWKSYIPKFDYIFSSPLLRALETGGIIKEQFNLKINIIPDTKLRPGSDTNEIIDIINGLKAEHLAIIGHQPDLSMHASNLISNSGANMNFSAGTIAAIKFNEDARLSNGRLLFLIP